MFSSNTSQVSSDALFIEDVFSTTLYQGNDSTQTITNSIDLAGKGGLVWFKGRNTSGTNNLFIDTVRGGDKEIYSNTTDAQSTWAGYDISSFNANGFSLQGDRYWNNRSGQTYASWTFRKAPKFFDVVTYTGNGVAGRQIAHNLGSVPGCIIVKRTNATSDWYVYHRGMNGGTNPQNYYAVLNSTAAQGTYQIWGNTAPTSTVFTVDEFSGVNGSGDTYVAYLFAHNAGGFGLTGTDNVISCGGFTVSGGATTTVNLGYEPQWVLIKRVDTTGNWELFDSMRGFSVDFNNSAKLFPNLSDAESAPGGSARVAVTSTGFQYNPADSADQMIYIAIRRGPMKTPTSGTSVFAPAFNQSSTGILAYLGQPTDFWIRNDRTGSDHNVRSRMTGGGFLLSNSTAAEGTQALNWWDNQVGVGVAGTSYGANSNIINYLFRRAPGFFDEVCYTGTGVARTVSHNLGVVPELMIVKRRSAAQNWFVYSAALGNTKYLQLNTVDGQQTSATIWNSTTPTSSVFSLSADTPNISGDTNVAYLFASCPGVSKVGSYTGTGSSQTINCGFTGGARFVLIKRTDSTGDWYVWDTARGMVAGTDPSLLLNSTAAEVNANSVYTTTGGFQIVSTAAGINASGGTYIFLAIA